MTIASAAESDRPLTRPQIWPVSARRCPNRAAWRAVGPPKDPNRGSGNQKQKSSTVAKLTRNMS